MVEYNSQYYYGYLLPMLYGGHFCFFITHSITCAYYSTFILNSLSTTPTCLWLIPRADADIWQNWNFSLSHVQFANTYIQQQTAPSFAEGRGDASCTNQSIQFRILHFCYRPMKLSLIIHCLTIFILFGTLFYPLFTHINSVCNLPLISFTVYSLRNLKNPYMFFLLYSNLKSKSYILMQ